MEYAIVTVRTTDGTWEADMELPAHMKLKLVAAKVLDTIKALDEKRFEAVFKLHFIYEKKRLNEEAALADYDIWDGSILFISR